MRWRCPAESRSPAQAPVVARCVAFAQRISGSKAASRMFSGDQHPADPVSAGYLPVEPITGCCGSVARRQKGISRSLPAGGTVHIPGYS